MKLAKAISQSKVINIFIGVVGLLVVFVGLIAILVGLFASLHSLITWDPGLHGIKLGIGIGGLVYGTILLFLGLVGVKTSTISDINK